LKLSPDRQEYRVDAKKPSRLRLNTAFYPGWKVLVDGSEKKIEPEAGTGLVLFHISAGEHGVVARLDSTPLRAASRWISLVTIILLLTMAAVEFFRRHKRSAP
jgi:hypothetical protein